MARDWLHINIASHTVFKEIPMDVSWWREKDCGWESLKKMVQLSTLFCFLQKHLTASHIPIHTLDLREGTQEVGSPDVFGNGAFHEASEMKPPPSGRAALGCACCLRCRCGVGTAALWLYMSLWWTGSNRPYSASTGCDYGKETPSKIAEKNLQILEQTTKANILWIPFSVVDPQRKLRQR